MADKLISPLAVTFVRASAADESKYYATAQDRLRVQSGEAQAFVKFRVSLPERLDLIALTLEVFSEEDDLAGTLTAREVVLSGPTYRNMTWNNRPSTRTGSVDRVLTESGRRHYADVTTDYGATLLEDGTVSPWLAYRLSASSSTKQWLVGPSAGRFAPRLRMVTQPKSFDPFDLSPAGNVGVLKPTFQWTVPLEVTHVQVQVDELGGDFATPLYDTGQVAPASMARNVTYWPTGTSGPAWAGIPVGGASARVRHWTTTGPSEWQEVEVAYLPKTAVALTNPGATDADPTPPLVWSPAADSVQVLVWRGAVLIGDSGIVPGPITTYTPSKGARTAGESIRREVRWMDGEDRASSIGDPPWVLLSQTTVFEPTDTVPGLDGLSVWQEGDTPAVSINYARTTGVPDEVSIERGGDVLYRLPGTEFPVLRDWTFAPNTEIPVTGRAVVNREHSAETAHLTVRTKVTGVWLVDPETERGFVLDGTDGLQVQTDDAVVLNAPISAATMLRRTLVLREESGTMAGTLGVWPGRTAEQQREDVLWLRERPRLPLRLIMGDLNIPVTASIGKPTFDRDRMRTHRAVHNVSFSFSHAGEQ